MLTNSIRVSLAKFNNLFALLGLSEGKKYFDVDVSFHRLASKLCRCSGSRVGLVLTTLSMSSEVPGFNPRHLQTDFKLLGVSEW